MFREVWEMGRGRLLSFCGFLALLSCRKFFWFGGFIYIASGRWDAVREISAEESFRICHVGRRTLRGRLVLLVFWSTAAARLRCPSIRVIYALRNGNDREWRDWTLDPDRWWSAGTGDQRSQGICGPLKLGFGNFVDQGTAAIYCIFKTGYRVFLS